MKNKFKLFELAVLLTAIVFSFAACKNDTTPTPTTDPALNGTWESERVHSGTFGGVDYTNKTERMTISNGIKEDSITDVCNTKRESFTTEVIGTMKITLTHIWGKSISPSLEAKWYSQAELKKPAVLTVLESLSITADEVDEIFAESETAIYSISGNRLTVTWKSGTTEYYNRIH